MSQHLTTCTFCGVGCGVYLETGPSGILGVYPSMSHPANHGRICVRGWHVHEVASSPDRLTGPLVRKNGQLEPVSWDEAYDTVAHRLAEVARTHGPDSIGFLNSARCSNEDTYLLQKFARAVVGTNNVDQGTSLYRTHSIEVLRGMLGVPAATNSIADLSLSRLIILNDIDVGQQLPTIGGWIIRAKLNGTVLVAVGSRRHRVAEHADIFLQIRPGTENFLYGAIAKVIIDRGLIDREFIDQRCVGFQPFIRNMQFFDVFDAAQRCGIEHEMIEKAALAIAQTKPASLLYSTGAEANGLQVLRSMVNLVLLTGNLGTPGSGVMPLAEHNNVQGGCDMGMLPRYLPGYKSVAIDTYRAEFEKTWNCRLPDSQGLKTTDILSARGRCKALWLDRHNPVVSATYCDASAAMEKMDFVVLQNLFMTRTAEQADVILPTAAYGEETVSFTSTERRIQLAVKAVEPPEGLVPAWMQVVEVARRMGSKWTYSSSADVMSEISSLVPEYQAATHDNLGRAYGRQWPCDRDNPLGTERLFERSQQKRFRFALLDLPSAIDPEIADFPFVLAFGHSLYYWHQNTLVQHSETLKREYGILLLDFPNGFVEINPEDAKAAGIREGQKVCIFGSAGKVESVARVTNEVKRGIIYVPYFLRDFASQLLGESADEGPAGRRVVHVRLEKVA